MLDRMYWMLCISMAANTMAASSIGGRAAVSGAETKSNTNKRTSVVVAQLGRRRQSNRLAMSPRARLGRRRRADAAILQQRRIDAFRDAARQFGANVGLDGAQRHEKRLHGRQRTRQHTHQHTHRHHAKPRAGQFGVVEALAIALTQRNGAVCAQKSNTVSGKVSPTHKSRTCPRRFEAPVQLATAGRVARRRRCQSKTGARRQWQRRVRRTAT